MIVEPKNQRLVAELSRPRPAELGLFGGLGQQQDDLALECRSLLQDRLERGLRPVSAVRVKQGAGAQFARPRGVVVSRANRSQDGHELLSPE